MRKISLFHNSITPYVFLFIIACLAYLPNFTGWGFYRDDWHMLWSANTSGPSGVLRLFSTDRPFMGLIYGWEWLVLGNSPIAWNIFAFLLRVSGIFLFFNIAKKIFPGNHLLGFTAAILFSIYPGYWQLPNGNTYQNHQMSLLLALASLYLSLDALKTENKNWRIVKTILALITQSGYLMIAEYMIGFEAARLFLFFYVSQPDSSKTSLKRQIRGNSLRYLPYLLMAFLFLVWRFIIFKSARLTTDVGFLTSTYLNHPIKMAFEMFATVVQDFVEVVFLSWSVPFYLFNGQTTAGRFYPGLIIGFTGCVLFLIFINRYLPKGDESSPPDPPWRKLYLLSIAMTVAAILPVIFGNRQIEFGNSFDRYTLHAIPGAVLCLTGLIWQIFHSRRMKMTVVSLLIVSSLMVHYQNGLNFKQLWEYQRQLWWQLSWRAPDIKTGTTLLAMLPEGYRLAEHYEIWAPVNLIYHPQGEPAIMGEVINSDTLPDILIGASYGRTFRRLPLVIDLKNSLVLSIPPGGSCLHIQDGTNPELSPAEDPLVRLIASRSNLDLVDTSVEPHTPPSVIFGKEPAHNWCYFYQKAALARQQGDWKTVAALHGEAQDKGLSPVDPAEWMPFYEAYAWLGDVPAVTELAQKLRAETDFIGPYCQSLQVNSFDENYRQYLLNLCP